MVSDHPDRADGGRKDPVSKFEYCRRRIVLLQPEDRYYAPAEPFDPDRCGWPEWGLRPGSPANSY